MNDADVIDHLEVAGWARPIDLCHAVYDMVGDDLLIGIMRTVRRMASVGVLVQSGLHYRLASKSDLGPPPTGSVRDLPEKPQAVAVSPLPARKRKRKPAPERARPPEIERPPVQAPPPKAKPPRPPPPNRTRGDIAAAAADKDLGLVPDGILAARYGVSHMSLRRIRRAAGIPAACVGRPALRMHEWRATVLQALAASHSRPMTICRASGLNKDQVGAALRSLIESGDVVRADRGNYALSV